MNGIWDQFLSEVVGSGKREQRLADKTVRQILEEYTVWLSDHGYSPEGTSVP
jgi:hypothetical protein